MKKTNKANLEIRRKEISEELGIPIEKIRVYPYKPPLGTEWPTPFQIETQMVFLEDESLTTIYTYYGTRKREERVIKWLKENKHLL